MCGHGGTQKRGKRSNKWVSQTCFTTRAHNAKKTGTAQGQSLCTEMVMRWESREKKGRMGMAHACSNRKITNIHAAAWKKGKIRNENECKPVFCIAKNNHETSSKTTTTKICNTTKRITISKIAFASGPGHKRKVIGKTNSPLNENMTPTIFLQ